MKEFCEVIFDIEIREKNHNTFSSNGLLALGSGISPCTDNSFTHFLSFNSKVAEQKYSKG